MSQAQIIEEAVRVCGSAKALAEQLQKAPSRISLWRTGSEPIPPDALAYMAELAGQDPIAVLAKEKGGLWGKLRAASVVGLLVATCAALVLGVPQLANAASHDTDSKIVRCVLCQIDYV